MKFLISKTSGSYQDDDEELPPIPGATIVEYDDMDIRTISSPEEFDARFPEQKWIAPEYSDYGVMNGRIHRKRGTQKLWTIDVETLEELIALAEKEGHPVIVWAPDVQERLPARIEIYNYYRE